MSQAPENTAAPQPGQRGYWRWLYHQMLAAMASGSWLRYSGYSVPGRTFNYRSLDEFRKLLDWVKGQADMEDGIPSYKGRIYAGQGGRGR